METLKKGLKGLILLALILISTTGCTPEHLTPGAGILNIQERSCESFPLPYNGQDITFWGIQQNLYGDTVYRFTTSSSAVYGDGYLWLIQGKVNGVDVCQTRHTDHLHPSILLHEDWVNSHLYIERIIENKPYLGKATTPDILTNFTIN